MDTTGQAPDTHRAVNGQPPDQHQAGTGQAADWLRVAELYAQLGVDPRTVRRWITRNVPSEAQERRENPDGGSAELYLRADYLGPLQAAYSTGQAPDAHRTLTGQAAGEQRTGTGQAPGAEAEGWRELATQLRGELNRSQAEIDRLRSELATERVAHQEALRRAEGAELARTSTEARLEALKASWWRWYALAQQHVGTARWFRPVRDLPEPPAELVADRLLAKPPLDE